MIELFEATGAMLTAGHAPTVNAIMLVWAMYTNQGEQEKADELARDFIGLRGEVMP